MSHLKLWCAFCCLVSITLDCSASDLWVDTQSLSGTCSNLRAPTTVTKTTPLCTLGAAAGMVSPGDVVHVRAGIYNSVDNCSGCEGRAVLQLRRAGTATQWIRFMAEPGEAVILEGTTTATIGVRIIAMSGVYPSFNELQGFQVHGFSLDCVSYDGVPDIRLIGFDVSQCGRQSMALHRAQRVTLRGSSIHDSNTNGWTSAIDLYLCQDGNVISGNRIWNNSDSSPGQPDSEGHGLIMDYCPGTGGTVIENNLIFNNEGWCMVVLNSNGAVIRNNVCYHNGIRQDGSGELSTCGNNLSIFNNILAPRKGQLALNIRLARSDFVVDTRTLSENNDLLDVQADAIAVAWGDAVGTLSQFQSRNRRGWGTASLAADPRFVDEVGLNFPSAEQLARYLQR